MRTIQNFKAPCCVLVADPPWQTDDSYGPRGAASKYKSLLTVDEICSYTLPKLAKRGVLFLWTIESMAEEAYRVVRAWGFTPKTSMIWVKQTSGGKRAFGTGCYVRAEHERVIIATRGKGAFRPVIQNVRSTFTAKVGGHSEKPVEFFRIVESMYPIKPNQVGSHVELFARQRREGWVQSGNELV